MLGMSQQGALCFMFVRAFSPRLLQQETLSLVVFQHVFAVYILVAQFHMIMTEPGLLPTLITQSFLKHLRNGHKF
jgi:hypothetical protein